MEDEQPKMGSMDEIESDGFQGARWFARLVNAYANTIQYGHTNERAQLVANFQDLVLKALLDIHTVDHGLLAITDRAEFLRTLERQDREAAIKLAEREAKLKTGG